jgi:BirA family biotin operon repressor/biotin-[acetyl-CoA-carboxylase] ligase
MTERPTFAGDKKNSSQVMNAVPPPASLLIADDIYRYLGRRSFVKRVYAFDSIDSTQSYAKSIITSLDKNATLIFAESQTRGKGRFNRQWESEAGKNLTFSLVVKTRMPQVRMGIVPLCTSELVARAVAATAHVTVQTKWPNDLFLGGKKFCGILIETVTKQDALYLVVGIGVNVNQQAFPDDLNATSLFLETGRTINRKELLRNIVNKLQWLCHVPPQSEIDAMLRKWKERCIMFGKNAVIESGTETFSGLVKNLGSDGALIVKIGETDRKFYAGDVTIIQM